MKSEWVLVRRDPRSGEILAEVPCVIPVDPTVAEEGTQDTPTRHTRKESARKGKAKKGKAKKGKAKTSTATKASAPQSTATATETKRTSAGKAKAAKSTAKQAKRTSPRKAKAKAATPKWDLRAAGMRERFDAAVLEAVKEGAVTAPAVPPKIGGTQSQVLAALGRLTTAGKLEIVKEGPPARYRPTRAKEPAKPKKASLPRLKWTNETRNNRKGQVAPWEKGVFRIIETSGGAWALFYEVGDGHQEYGCGTSRAVKAEARKIAAAGLPTADQWRQMGRSIDSCPISTRRVTKARGVELVWEESIRDGRKVCLAPSVAGEFKMVSSDDGSFALVFLTPGGSIEDLGCGAMGTLHRRALEIEGAQIEELAEEDGPVSAEDDAEVDDDAEQDDAEVDDDAEQDDAELDAEADDDDEADDEADDDADRAEAEDGVADDRSETANASSREDDKKLMMQALADALREVT